MGLLFKAAQRYGYARPVQFLLWRSYHPFSRGIIYLLVKKSYLKK